MGLKITRLFLSAYCDISMSVNTHPLPEPSSASIPGGWVVVTATSHVDRYWHKIPVRWRSCSTMDTTTAAAAADLSFLCTDGTNLNLPVPLQHSRSCLILEYPDFVLKDPADFRSSLPNLSRTTIESHPA
ncbi:hypothetical protein AYO21_10179 [Fonsecaea monophora]|uniref:Uncharacterized protein n=1 Tax=Fonsecaea monophora TaxID=254056 RepID=A0A177EXF6_9EURO|nr:hypothetical protein AYO21_10179 [Fonsecaea monophora]OAG35639.1 hypothetical protein AYO21_10179 [Fonsecaea monophora]